jgi:RNA polymerase sigma-70 factor (ECF subfamily)
MAAAAEAIAVPQMPVKWTDLISDENMPDIKPRSHPGRKIFERKGSFSPSCGYMNLVMPFQIEDLVPTRYSLLSRLQDWGDQQSWKEFFDAYWRLIYSFARKSGLTETEAQDVVQETIISVAKDLQKFKRDRSLGTFKGWLLNLTRWRIADQLRMRAQSAREQAAASETTAPAAEDWESIWEEEWQSNLLEAAIDNVRRHVREEQYQIFDLYVIKQWPVQKVAEALGIGVGRVYLAKHRVSALVKKEVRRLEKCPDCF